jgi:hypothetical protein
MLNKVLLVKNGQHEPCQTKKKGILKCISRMQESEIIRCEYESMCNEKNRHVLTRHVNACQRRLLTFFLGCSSKPSSLDGPCLCSLTGHPASTFAPLEPPSGITVATIWELLPSHQENTYMLELAYHAYCHLALALSVLSSPKLSEHFAAVFNKIARDAKHKLSINKPD